MGQKSNKQRTHSPSDYDCATTKGLTKCRIRANYFVEIEKPFLRNEFERIKPNKWSPTNVRNLKRLAAHTPTLSLAELENRFHQAEAALKKPKGIDSTEGFEELKSSMEVEETEFANGCSEFDDNDLYEALKLTNGFDEAFAQRAINLGKQVVGEQDVVVKEMI